MLQENCSLNRYVPCGTLPRTHMELQAGDITAATALEECVATGMMITGVLFFGLLISSISDLMDVRPSHCNTESNLCRYLISHAVATCGPHMSPMKSQCCAAGQRSSQNGT